MTSLIDNEEDLSIKKQSIFIEVSQLLNDFVFLEIYKMSSFLIFLET